MKFIQFTFITAFTALIGTSATFSKGVVYTGSSTWYTSATTFAELDVLGAAYNAIEAAVKNCRDADHSVCELKSVRLVSVGYASDGRREIVHTATVRGYNSRTLEKVEKYEGFEEANNTNSQIDNLTSLGAKYDALTSALEKCYTTGNDVCGIKDVDYSEVNQWDQGAYRTKAIAHVTGYRIAEHYENREEDPDRQNPGHDR